MKSLATAGIFFHNQLLNSPGHYLKKFIVPTPCLKEFMMLIAAILDS